MTLRRITDVELEATYYVRGRLRRFCLVHMKCGHAKIADGGQSYWHARVKTRCEKCAQGGD